MTERDRIRALFLEEFRSLRSALEAALDQPSEALIARSLEFIRERSGPLDEPGYLRIGFGLGVLETLMRLDVGETLIDRVLERASKGMN
jgi:hypothetical protein